MGLLNDTKGVGLLAQAKKSVVPTSSVFSKNFVPNLSLDGKPAAYVPQTEQPSPLLKRDLKISAQPQNIFQKLYNKLPQGVQDIGSDIKQGLFGSKEPDITGEQRYVGGILKRGDVEQDKAADAFQPFRLVMPKPKEQRYFERYDALVASGIDKERADLIAKNAIQEEGTMSVAQGGPLQRPEIQLTSVEKKALKPLVIDESLDKIFAALDMVSFGTLGKASKPLIVKVAKSKSSFEILDLLKGELKGYSDEALDAISKLLVHVDDADDVQRVFNKIEFAKQEAKGAQQTEKSIIREAISQNPATQLQKYVSRTTGRLPEVTGKPTLQSLTGSGKVVKNSDFGIRGDDIVTELGFKDVNEAQQALDDLAVQKARLKEVDQPVTPDLSALKDTDKAIETEARKYKTAEEFKVSLQKQLDETGHNPITGGDYLYHVSEQPNLTSIDGAKSRNGTTYAYGNAPSGDRSGTVYMINKSKIPPENITVSGGEYHIKGVIPQDAFINLGVKGNKPFDVTTAIWNKANKPLKFSDEGIPLALNKREQAIRDKGIASRQAIAGPKTSSSGLGKTQAPSAATTLSVSEVQSLEQTLSTQDLAGKIDIPETIKGDSKAISSYTNSIQKKILDAREAAGMFDEFRAVAQDPVEFPEQVLEVRNMADKMDLKNKANKYKDIGNTKKQLRDITRNSQQVFGDDFKIIDDTIFEPWNQAKGDYIDTMNTELADFDKNIFKKFKQGSKEDRAIQLFGEKEITKADLIKDFGEQRAQEIMDAEQWFRKTYDREIGTLNRVEQKIYPNNPEKWTPKRKDYFRHYHELKSNFSHLQNILNNPIKIDPMLVGISEGTKPKSRWASFKQRRLGTKTDVSAIGGYLDYLPSYSYAINIDPHIGKFRELAETLARDTVKSKNLNNYIYNLHMFANQLSGKTAELDRIITEMVPGGRTTLAVVDWTNRRVKANTILANISSSISQIFNVPQGIAKAGPINSAKGLKTTLAQNFVPNKEMEKSIFLKERYFKGFNKFDKGILNNAKKFAVWMVNALDEAGTKFIWNGQYEQAIELGIENPIKYADDATKLLVGGRGIGEKPLLQNSKAWQVIAPFQLEVTNLWWAMEDLAKSNDKIMKKFGQFATLFVSLWLLNNASEKTTGHRVAFDPIEGVIDAVGELQERPNTAGATRAGGRLLGEVLSNVPFGQTVATWYPQYGGTAGSVELPTRKELFGKEDPTRFGSGLLTVKALSDPLYKILPPFGGSQIKKTVGGVQAVKQEISKDKAGRTQYEVGGTFWKDLQAVLFGKYAGKEAQNFFEGTTFTEAQLNKLLESPETAKAELIKMAQEDPDQVKKILAEIKKRATGITEDEEKIKNLGVENGQRAEEVAKKLNKLKTNEEKKALAIDYVKKGILTEEVFKQVLELLNK